MTAAAPAAIPKQAASRRELPRATRIVQEDTSLRIEGEGGSGTRIQVMAFEPAAS